MICSGGLGSGSIVLLAYAKRDREIRSTSYLLVSFVSLGRCAVLIFEVIDTHRGGLKLGVVVSRMSTMAFAAPDQRCDEVRSSLCLKRDRSL
jgi:hypothetical protein